METRKSYFKIKFCPLANHKYAQTCLAFKKSQSRQFNVLVFGLCPLYRFSIRSNKFSNTYSQKGRKSQNLMEHLKKFPVTSKRVEGWPAMGRCKKKAGLSFDTLITVFTGDSFSQLKNYFTSFHFLQRSFSTTPG